MSSDTTELFSSFFNCMSWAMAVLYLALGVVGLLRLRSTPAGILIGGGFVAYAVTGLLWKALRLLILPEGSVGEPGGMERWAAISLGSSCTSTLFLLAIGVGFLLLPRSLQRLESAS